MSQAKPASSTCPECSKPVVITVVGRAFDGDFVELRRRADCTVCYWHGFDWKKVLRSADVR